MTEVLAKRLPSEADMDGRDLVMGDNQRVFYQCPPPTADKAIPPITSSPSHSRSPRCEAFLMTGDKMLNLNPKISPHYAKVCQNQLPPTVQVDSSAEEEAARLLASTPKGTTSSSHRQFDQFPSMHNGGRKRMQSATTATSDGTDSLPLVAMPESHSEHVLDGAKGKSGEDKFGTGMGISKGIQLEQHSMTTTESYEGGSGGNIVPADPSNRRHYQSSISTLPENATSGEPQKFVASQINELPGMEKGTDISRFIVGANAATASQSTPASPARMFLPQHQQGGVVENGATKVAQQQHHSDATVQTRGASTRNSSTDAGVMVQSAYSPETVARLARHLFTHQEGIKIAAFLVKSDDLSLRIAHEFVSLFNFAGYRVDAALRTFLSHVCLTGETGDRTQLLSHFAHRYHECNPTVFNSAEEIHALTCALLLLNTDLHGKQQNKSKMCCRDFIENLAHTGFKYDGTMLKELYATVRAEPFHYRPGEEPPIQPQAAPIGMGREKRLSRVLTNKKGSSASASNVMVNPEQQVDYKHGWLLKKAVYDADGKKTPIGRRKWQMLYATIRGMVLYLHQNENSFASGRYITFRNCILLHHSQAELPRDYAKKKNVFRLRTANLGEFLFQTSDPTEVQKWIDAINYVAAAFSTPALPTPVGANGIVAFYKPHLPSVSTHLSIPDQLRAHEQRLEETTANLARLRENAPSMKARGKVVYDYFYKERYLDTQRERYAIYVNILREKLARASSTLRCDSTQSTSTLMMNNGKNKSPHANGFGGHQLPSNSTSEN